jgi:hypothetical protein
VEKNWWRGVLVELALMGFHLCGTFIDFDPIELKLAALNYHWIFVSIGIKNLEDVRKSKGRG